MEMMSAVRPLELLCHLVLLVSVCLIVGASANAAVARGFCRCRSAWTNGSDTLVSYS